MARSILLVCLALLCAAAGFREFQGGQADRIAATRTPGSFREALQYTPGDGAKWRQLGIALIRSESGDALGPLQRAIQLSPCDAEALVGLGYESERHRRLADAERYYLRAAECSRRFQPRYALAGFYLRTGNQDRFWPVASEAVNIPEADVTRILKLAQSAGAGPNEIGALLDLRTEHATAAYVAFALAAGGPDGAAAAALRLPAVEKHQAILVRTCEQLIQAGRAEAAVSIWNRLPDTEKLDPATGRSLAGGNFGELRNTGFHWRYPGLPGTTARAAGASGLRIDFSGEQPEHGAVLVKAVPVLPGRRYRLTVAYASGDLRGPTGLVWTAAPLHGAPIATAALDGTEDGTAQTEFVAPGNCSLLEINLMYTRVPGSVRIEGAVHLRSARLELLP